MFVTLSQGSAYDVRYLRRKDVRLLPAALRTLAMLTRKCLQSHACLLYSTAVYKPGVRHAPSVAVQAALQCHWAEDLSSLPYRHAGDAVLRPVQTRCMCVRQRWACCRVDDLHERKRGGRWTISVMCLSSGPATRPCVQRLRHGNRARVCSCWKKPQSIFAVAIPISPA